MAYVILQMLLPVEMYFFHLLFYFLAFLSSFIFIKRVRRDEPVEFLIKEIRRIKKNVILWLCLMEVLCLLLVFVHGAPFLLNAIVIQELLLLAAPIAIFGEVSIRYLILFYWHLKK